MKRIKTGQGSIRSMSYDSKFLPGPLNNFRVIHSQKQAPSGTQFSGKFPSLSLPQRPGKGVNATDIVKMQHPGCITTGIYSATFLEIIIAGIFLNLFTSLQGKNVKITEAQLNEMNILNVKSLMDEFNNAQVTVLWDVEERIYFPPSVKKLLVSLLTPFIMFPGNMHCKLAVAIIWRMLPPQ